MSNGEASLRKSSFKKPFIVLIVLIVVVAGFVVAAISFGYLSVATKMPSQKIDVSERVCGKAVIGRYNDAIRQTVSSVEERTAYNGRIIAVANDVKNLSNWQQDPTCLAIVFDGSILANNITDAKQSYDLLKPLVERGVFVDTTLSHISSIEEMNSRLQIPDNNDPNSLGSG